MRLVHELKMTNMKLALITFVSELWNTPEAHGCHTQVHVAKLPIISCMLLPLVAWVLQPQASRTFHSLSTEVGQCELDVCIIFSSYMYIIRKL